MNELMISNISEQAFSELTVLANKNGISVEEQAKQIIEGFFLKEEPQLRSEVSKTFLSVNPDKVLTAAERSPVFVRGDDGIEFVILGIEEFGWLTGVADEDSNDS